MIDPPLSAFVAAALLIVVGFWLYLKYRNSPLNTEKTNIVPRSEDRLKAAGRAERRRAQTGLLFVLSGTAMFAGLEIHPQLHPNLWGGAWILTLLFLLWGMLITAADLLAARFQLREIKRQKEALRLAASYLDQQKKERENAAEAEAQRPQER